MIRTTKLGSSLTLLGSVSIFALGAAVADAQTVDAENSNAFISVDQFNEATGGSSEVNIDGSVDMGFSGTLSQSESGTTTDILNQEFTTNIIENEAIVGIVSDTNNDNIGVDLAGISASSVGPPPAPDAEVGDANLAIDSIQRNTNVAATGSTTVDIESITTANVSDSTTTATGNLQSSSGELNLIDSIVDAEANESTATVGIATSQLNTDSNLTFETDSSVEVNVEGNVDDSMLSVTSNTQNAFGAGNSATNDIEGAVNQADILVGNEAATLADITNEGRVSASTAAAFAIANTQTQIRSSLDAVAGEIGDGFSLNISGSMSANDIEAVELANDSNIATSSILGNEAANSITLSLNGVDTIEFGTSFRDVGTTAAIGSVQDNSDVEATATTLAGVATTIDGEASETQISTSLNTLSATSELSTATNTMTVDANQTAITADTEASEASASTASTETAFSISNAQASNADSTSTATMFDDGGTDDSSSVTTSVGDQVLNSTVDSNNNTMTATALGNETANQITLSLNGVNIFPDGGSSGNPIVVDGYVAGIANTQASEADVLAQGPAADAVALTVVANLDSSQLSASENTVETSATANTGANLIVVDEATNLTTTSAAGDSTSSSVTAGAVTATADAAFAVASRQEASGTITASLVDDVTDPQDGAAIAATISGDILDSEISADDNMLSATAIGNEITPSTNAVSITGANVATSTAVANEQVLNGATVQALVGAPGTPSQTPTAGGVSVTASGDILRSMITVDDNTSEGSVTGNTATNLIEASASTLAQGSDAIISSGSAEPTAVTATSDNSLTNQQTISSGSTLDTTVGSAFAVVQDSETDVESSVISVSENEQTATTLGNEASNVIRLDAGEITSGAALVSNQDGSSDTTVDATSAMEVYAPGANSDSTLSLNDNENSAVASTNTVSNSVTVTGEIASLGTLSAGADVTSDPSASNRDTQADYVVSSLQSSAASVDAEATSTVVNGDGGSDPSTVFDTDGVVSSTVDMIGNSTTAEATANASGNFMSLNGDGENMPATAALLNDQNASGTVRADATNTVNLTIDTTTPGGSPLSASTVTLSGNATTARGTANSATNSMSLNALNLNKNAGTADVEGIITTTGESDVQASYALMNDQSNDAEVDSLATATYTMTLDAKEDSAIDLSTGDVTGNSVLAQGTGNVAQNTASLTAGNTGLATAGVLNAQTNTAAISSDVVSASIGVYPTVTNAMAVNGSTVGVLNNTVRAFANGNSATNTMNVSALNLTDASSGSSSFTGTALNVNASFASLNDQTNSGRIESNVASTSIGVFPNDPSTALNNSTVNVSGNSVRAQAVGNSATNTATLTALDYGSSSVGVGNSQTNTGDIIASVGGTSVGMDGSAGADGAISSSSVTIGGSSINATAVGNSVVSTISRN